VETASAVVRAVDASNSWRLDDIQGGPKRNFRVMVTAARAHGFPSAFDDAVLSSQGKCARK
jgi:hypothetical protein